jgi:hypothetical protein
MRRRRHPRALSFLATGGASALVVLVIIGGCASETEDGDLNASSTSSGGSVIGSSGSNGESGASGSGGTSGTTSSGGFDSSVPDVSFSYDAPYAKDGDACAEVKGVATKKQVDMFVMLDRSGSMNYPCNVGNCESGNPPRGDCNVGQTLTPNSKWCNTINAVSKYFKSAQATGNAAAMQSFLPPSVTGLTVQQLCDASGTTSSNDLSASSVPGAATGYVNLPSSSFDTFLNNLIPEGQTPTRAAARGIVKFTGRAANQRAGRITIGVLITDGDPTLCTESTTLAGEVQGISDILQAHYNATGIPTFVIGMNGATFSSLETIATGGSAPMHNDTVGTLTDACGNGAGPCRHFNIADGNNEALAEALNLIQGFAVACKYNIPKPLVGAINYKDVVVSYDTTQLTKVANAAACVADGWYYDNDLSPQTINLCPAQCTTAQENPTAKINVSFGCLGG